MNEQLRKRLVYGALVLAIIYGVYNFLPARKPTVVTPPETIEPLVGAVAEAAAKLDEPTVAALEARPWGRDPFGKPTRAVEATPRQTWTLRGIIYSAAKPLAYINGARVGIGDKVNNATVVAIDKTKVTLEFGGSQFDVFVRKG